MKTMVIMFIAVTFVSGAAAIIAQETAIATQENLWQLAQREKGTHRFSTLITAQDVRDRLSRGKGLQAAIDWCQQTGVTRVFIEEFRDGYQAERATILRARDRFQKEGIDVSGCVTTTRVGKPSTGWKEVISCYTHKPTQFKLKSIFEYAASLFDEIMIDDFWFTDCSCQECQAARQARLVSIGDKSYPVAGDTWEDYRCELMTHLSRDYVLDAARRVNPRSNSSSSTRNGTTSFMSGVMRSSGKPPTLITSGWAQKHATTRTDGGGGQSSMKLTSSCAGWVPWEKKNAEAVGTIGWVLLRALT